MTQILLGVALSLIANEIFAVGPWCAAKLALWAARRRYADPRRAEIRAEEWAALIDRQPGNLVKLVTAVSFAGSALAHTGLNGCRQRLAHLLAAQQDQSKPAITVISEGPADFYWRPNTGNGKWQTAIQRGESTVFLDADGNIIGAGHRQFPTPRGASWRQAYFGPAEQGGLPLISGLDPTDQELIARHQARRHNRQREPRSGW